MLANETYPQGMRTLRDNHPSEFRRLLKGYPGSTASESSESRVKLGFECLRMVSEYTKCDLTKDEDILVALSGLAKTWGAAFPDKYLLGIWYKSLPYSLLWYADMGKLTSKSSSNIDWRAPSWSWASCNYEVVF